MENIPTEDLISILLKTGTKDVSVKQLSLEILSNIDNLKDLKNITISKLTRIKGIGKIKAMEIISAMELGRRVHYQTVSNRKKIKTATDIFQHMKSTFVHQSKEHFYVVYLDYHLQMLETKLLFIGNKYSCIIDPAEIFKHAYLLSASYFICIHNHPSGDVTPSKNDDINTLKLIFDGRIFICKDCEICKTYKILNSSQIIRK